MENIRSFDILIPWERIRSDQFMQIEELELISKWISDNTKDDEVIFSEYDHIRYFSKRSLLGSKEWPQKIDFLDEWYSNRLLYESFIRDPFNQDNLLSLKKLEINYIVLPKSVKTDFKTKFYTKNIKIIEFNWEQLNYK